MDDKNSKYKDILNRLKKNYSAYEAIFIIKKLSLTNNSFFYFFCIFLRFVYIISFTDIRNNLLRKRRRNNFQSLPNLLKKITCFEIMKQCNCSFNFYKISILIIFVIFIIRFVADIIMYKQFKKYSFTDKWPMPSKIRIIIDHANLILFPYLIEFFSFSFYAMLFPKKFFIKTKSSDLIQIILLTLINVILIIIYNIDNYINIICSNKIYLINNYDAYLNTDEEKIKFINKSVAFRDSNLFMYIVIILQNLVLLYPLYNYLNIEYKIIFKLVLSIFLILSIIIIFINKLNCFNYSNFINKFIDVSFLFCLYSILFEVIMISFRSRVKNLINEIIYALIKIIISYITYLLLLFKTNIFFEKKISEILFKEKLNKKTKYFINTFYYLHNLMLKIKEKKDIDSAFYLVKVLNKHANHCNKLACNCKLFEALIKIENNDKLNDEERKKKNYIFKLLIILNYLFEFVFIDYDFYNIYDLTILLSEHFCHLKNNPIMAFSIISTFILKKKNRLTIFQKIELYELSQKYIYYMAAKSKNNLEKEIQENKSLLLLNRNKLTIFKEYYYNLNFSIKMKKLINNYTDIEMKILKYKSIFADLLTFQFDENNENIISAKINFFNNKAKIENFENNFNSKNKRKNRGTKKKNGSNLYNVLSLLKEEYYSYRKIINSINKIDIKKEIPIFIIFKYFLFFDLFWGGKVSEEISNKLYAILNKNGINNNRNEYFCLKKKFNEENNKLDSKIYVLVEFKKDLRTKYFTESGALKLGYKQKDIINEKIDILMPKTFCKSHLNAIKQLVIGNQLSFHFSKQSYFFNINSTILYSVNLESALIYNITKSLITIFEANFNLENEYRFMLDNNFELLAHSKNFEDEYFLNHKILNSYNIKFLDLIKFKPEKLNKKFEKEIKKISVQKILKQIKIEEYFVPQLYLQAKDKNSKLFNHNDINSSIKNILSKFSKSENREEKFDENQDNQELFDDEEKRLINKEIIKNSIYELFINPREVVFHKTYNLIINRGNFIENIAKELTKIPENDLIFENDKVIYNLVKASKKLISNLLTKKELLNQSMTMKINFSFYYDKPFYFISIDDEKKLYLKISKTINFENSHKITKGNKKFKIPFNKDDTQSRNKKLISNKNILIEDKNQNKTNHFNKNKINQEDENMEKIGVINIINEFKKNINKDKFILIIKWILSIIIIIIMVIYISLIIFQDNLISILNIILKTYFHNINNKCLFLGIESSAIHIFYDSAIFTPKPNDIHLVNHYILTNLTQELKDSYHSFTDSFVSFNLKLGQDFDIIYRKNNFTRLRGFWKQIEYESEYSSEVDFIIYNIFNLNMKVKSSKESKDDFEKFLFFREREKEKIFSPFIRILYYLSNNNEFVFSKIFEEIESSIYKSSKNYISKNFPIYCVLEIFSLLLYLIFFIISIIFLNSSNNIIIKNIIFLFLDFSENHYDKNKINTDNNIITFKLLEFQKTMDDLDVNRFEKYSVNINNINKNNFNKGLNKALSIDINNKEKNMYDSSNTSKNKFTLKKKDIHKQDNNIHEQINASNEKGKLFLDIRNRALNNSSHNYLVDSNSNSHFFKDGLNNNSINASNEFLSSNNNMKNFSTKNAQKQNSFRKDDNEYEDNYQDIILNKSNKNIILKIRIFIIIILLLIFIVIFLISYKFDFFISFLSNYDQFFLDLTVLSNRYILLFKYFNNLRLLLIYPINEKKEILENSLEGFDNYFIKENNKYLDILTNGLDNYQEIGNIINFIKESKNNSTLKIKEQLCQGREYCINYLSSTNTIFDSGVDFALQISVKEINNIYLGYKKLNNKMDIKEINDTLIYSGNSKFVDISIALQYMFVSVESKIIQAFDADETSFRLRIHKNLNYLNIASIIYSIFTFLYVVLFIFASISRIINPIKDSTYRICCSFYYIKKYNLNYYKKLDSILRT